MLYSLLLRVDCPQISGSCSTRRTHVNNIPFKQNIFNILRKYKFKCIRCTESNQDNSKRLQSNTATNSVDKIDMIQEVRQMLNEQEEKLSSLYLKSEQQQKFQNQFLVQQLLAQMEVIGQKVVELNEKHSIANVSDQRTLSTMQDLQVEVQAIKTSPVISNLVNKVNHIEQVLQNLQSVQNQNKSEQNRIFEDTKQLVKDIGYVVPFLQTKQDGGNYDILQQKFSDELEQLKNSMRKENAQLKQQLEYKEQQISDLQNKVQALEAYRLEVQNRAYSKYDVSKLWNVEFETIERCYYENKYQYKLTFKVVSILQPKFEFYIPDTTFSQYLRDRTNSYYAYNQDKTYRNIHWCMTSIGCDAQKVILYSGGIERDSAELEVLIRGSEMYYFCGRIAHVMLIALEFGKPIYAEENVVSTYGKK